MLNNIPRLGYQVASISPREIIEVIEIRKIIELGSLEMCFFQVTKTELDQLKQLNEDAMKISGTKDIKLHWKNNQDFHRMLCSFSNNRYLKKTLEDVLNILYENFRISIFMKVWSESKVTDARGHIRLVEAI